MSTEGNGAERASRRGRRYGSWGLLLAVCVAAIGIVDGVITNESTGFFGTGFNGWFVGGALRFGLFVLASATIDATLVLGLWLLSLRPLGWLGVRGLPAFALAGALSFGLPLVVATARLSLESILGRLPLVPMEMVRGGSASVIAQMAEAVDPLVAGFFALSFAGATLLVPIARSVSRRIPDADAIFAAPRTRTLLAGFLVCASASVALLTAPSAALDRIRYGLRTKPSQMLLSEGIRRATDVDLDGFGWSDRPGDPSPFDRRIHPYAIDVPGNGVDENGLGGDHPPGFTAPEPRRVSSGPWARRPHVLLVLLESFRADLLEARIEGREVTPFLNRLAAEGASTRRAYSHCPSTVPSRAQLLSGEILYRSATSSLVDDFLEQGYHVAWFSGQDSSYGGTEAILGLDRLHQFYDARQDLARRTSRSAAAVSLQVSWKTVLERVEAHLETAPEGPLFMYVNFSDTHFPYVHDELDQILDVEPLSIDGIRATRAREVRRGYANTAANVDRAVERLFEAVRAYAGDDPVSVVITADHGQAFYENGYLGHARSVRGDQTRVPLVLWGLQGSWPEPLGLSDIRWKLLESLRLDPVEATHPVTFEPDPTLAVMHWAPSLERPTVIGLRTFEALAELDLVENSFRMIDLHGGDRRVGNLVDPARLRVIRSWEALQRSACESSDDDCDERL